MSFQDEVAIVASDMATKSRIKQFQYDGMGSVLGYQILSLLPAFEYTFSESILSQAESPGLFSTARTTLLLQLAKVNKVNLAKLTFFVKIKTELQLLLRLSNSASLSSLLAL
jgi:hypothetical protein